MPPVKFSVLDLFLLHKRPNIFNVLTITRFRSYPITRPVFTIDSDQLTIRNEKILRVAQPEARNYDPSRGGY